MGWWVRQARAADGARVAQIRVLSWQSAYRDLLPRQALTAMRPETSAQRWADTATAPAPTKLFVAVDDDDVPVAFCLVSAAREAVDRHPDLPTGELCAIYADPLVIGTGAGGAVHDAGMDYLARQGFRHVMLWVLEGNDSAMRFYRRHGWRPDGGRAGFEWGGTNVTELRYAKGIDQSNV